MVSVSFAQQGAKPTVPGTYYSAKDFEWKPPLPFNPTADLLAAECELGKFLVDDTSVPDAAKQAEGQRRLAEAAPAAKAIAADRVPAAAARQEAQEAACQREAEWAARLEAARAFLRFWGRPAMPKRTRPVRKLQPNYKSGLARQMRQAPTRRASRQSWTPCPGG